MDIIHELYLVSAFSPIQVDSHGIIFYTTYICVDLAHYEIFHAKVGKGGIKYLTLQLHYVHVYILFYAPKSRPNFKNS